MTNTWVSKILLQAASGGVVSALVALGTFWLVFVAFSGFSFSVPMSLWFVVEIGLVMLLPNFLIGIISIRRHATAFGFSVVIVGSIITAWAFNGLIFGLFGTF
jgi:hypothetical protein